MFGIDRKIVERLTAEYPAGTREELIQMRDPFSIIPAGTTGTVTGVDDLGTIHVNWDDGGCLGIAYGEDSCKKL